MINVRVAVREHGFREFELFSVLFRTRIPQPDSKTTYFGRPMYSDPIPVDLTIGWWNTGIGLVPLNKRFTTEARVAPKTPPRYNMVILPL